MSGHTRLYLKRSLSNRPAKLACQIRKITPLDVGLHTAHSVNRKRRLIWRPSLKIMVVAKEKRYQYTRQIHIGVLIFVLFVFSVFLPDVCHIYKSCLHRKSCIWLPH